MVGKAQGAGVTMFVAAESSPGALASQPSRSISRTCMKSQSIGPRCCMAIRWTSSSSRCEQDDTSTNGTANARRKLLALATGSVISTSSPSQHCCGPRRFGVAKSDGSRPIAYLHLTYELACGALQLWQLSKRHTAMDGGMDLRDAVATGDGRPVLSVHVARELLLSDMLSCSHMSA